MATKKEIESHVKLAMKEIGEIVPWFDDEVDAWIFESPLYPVECEGETAEEVVKNYPKYIQEFVKERLANNLDPLVEKKTKGRGGYRAGSGRPVGTKRVASKKTVRLDTRVAAWAKEHESEILDIIEGKKSVVTRVKRNSRKVS